MKKYLRNITVGTALVLVAGSCTGNFEEYNTNQFQIHEAVLDMFHRECGIPFVSTYSHWAVTQLQQMGKTLPVMQLFPKIQLS